MKHIYCSESLLKKGPISHAVAITHFILWLNGIMFILQIVYTATKKTELKRSVKYV